MTSPCAIAIGPKEMMGERNHRSLDISIESEEPATVWTEEDLQKNDDDDDARKGMSGDDTISSEEWAGSESDCEHRVKAKPMQDIWDVKALNSSLQLLPGAEEIQNLMLGSNLALLLQHLHGRRTGALLAAWNGKTKVLKFLLQNGADPQVSDEAGRTALHLASYSGHSACTELLLCEGAIPEVWDTFRKATPLHCAASRGSAACINHLLASGADVNAGLDKKSPLHYAVQSDAVDCVRRLLEAGAIPNTPQVFTETPLHVAAAMGSAECIRLLLQFGADVRVQFGPSKITPLHLAAQDGNAQCARLLLESGADITVTNSKLQTPLHLASLAQSAETLELLLRRGANPNLGDGDGRTPLHSAIVKTSRSCECVRLLLSAGANVNIADAFGYTPMHIAALNEFSNCILLLLNHGGDVTAKTNGGISALSFIVRRTPDVLPKYLSKFDSAIKLSDHEIGDVDCELKMDFRILVPCVGRGETELLLNFIQVGERDILKHPLCETFLFLKWRRIRKFFLLSMFYHTVFVLFFSTYIMGVFLDHDEKNEISLRARVAGYVLIGFNFLLLLKEIFQVAHSWTNYLSQWENWLQWLIIAGVFLCLLPNFNVYRSKSEISAWQQHVAAVVIFLAWLELMMIVGRFPMFGLYVQMFTTVAVNFSKFLLAYCCLFIAFSLSFSVLLHGYKSFRDPLIALMKTVIMMSGELEFEDIMFEDDQHTIPYPVTTHLIFLAFVLLVAVILTNLMVGLAVSDIQGLQQSAGLDRLVRQAELMAHFESMLFSRLLHCFPKKLLAFCHRSALLLTSSYHWALYVRPNDPRENRIPRYLIRAVYQLVVERKDKKDFPKGRKVGRYFSSRKAVNASPSVRMSRRTRPHQVVLEELRELEKDIKMLNEGFEERLEAIRSHLNAIK